MDAMERLIKDHEYLTPRDAEKAGVTRFHFTSPCVNTAGETGQARSHAPKTPGWMSFTFFTWSPQLVFSHDEAFYHYGYRNANRFSTP